MSHSNTPPEKTAEKAPVRIHLVCNTHWDREHRHAFQETRLMLVESIDRLLEIMEADPNYETFTFDGQAVFLEDYLEVRPQNRDRLKALIQAGRILIGPWYSLPDHSSVHPESIVRNLVLGHRVCRDFGPVMKFGYSIFSFGQFAQLPQVYAGFDIDSMIFYKGYARDRILRPEFLWQSPDGTRAVCSRLGPMGRANFFVYFTVPVVLGGDMCAPGQWKADYTGKTRLCHLVDDVFFHPHGRELKPDIRVRADKVKQAVEEVIESCADTFCKDVLLGFDGIDFSMPLAEMPEAVAEANRQMEGKVEILFSHPLRYFEEFREKVSPDTLPVYEGDMRYGPLGKVHCENLSSAAPIKQLMHRVEARLIQGVEPLAAFSRIAGGAEYPADMIQLAWRFLLKSQAHDSIHALGDAKIFPDTMDRLAQALEVTDGVYNRAVQNLISTLDTSRLQDDEILLTVVNPLPAERQEVMRLRLELPREELPQGYWLETLEGQRLNHYEHGRRSVNLASINNENRPKAMYLDQVDVDVECPKLPACGYRTFRLCREKGDHPWEEGAFANPHVPFQPIGRAPHLLDNGILRVEALPNGSIRLYDYRSKTTYDNLHILQDSGCAGDMWIHRPPRNNLFLTSLGRQADIALTRNSGLAATLRIALTLPIPESLTADRQNRSHHLVETTITTEVTLRKGSDRVDFKTTLDNRCKDHFLTARFETGLETGQVHAERAFEVEARPAWVETDEHGQRGTEVRRFPFHGFVDISDGKRGLAIFARGLHEYEPFYQDGKAALNLSLLRAVSQTFPIHEDVYVASENETAQCQDSHTFEYALCPHGGDYKTGDLLRKSRAYITPPVVAQHGGGPGGEQPLEQSYFTLSNPLTVVSACKQAEDEECLALRLSNPTDETVEETIAFFKPAKKARLANMNEESLEELPVREGGVSLTLKPYRIETLLVEF